ncbi:hypothetical protein [Acuticoccus sediminis]|uniref:hypothetical protein n=1 Tax=Acuticoccus sediminis TaxID=2184697 RepID=UPI001CFD3EEA|nr:hypothetical protein [Acuticoccus sediminis]
MTTIDDTALARLEAEGRLFNAVLKAEMPQPGRFGFRGDIALRFQQQMADEKRPPDYSIEQVATFARAGEATIPALAGYLHSFAYLEDVVAVMGDLLSPTGVYLMFCNNIDLRAQYRVVMNGIPFSVLPCDESTVWKELTELLGIEKSELKKLDTAGKTDVVLDALLDFGDAFDEITFQRGVEVMEPVRNRNENRPV